MNGKAIKGWIFATVVLYQHIGGRLTVKLVDESIKVILTNDISNLNYAPGKFKKGQKIQFMYCGNKIEIKEPIQ